MTPSKVTYLTPTGRDAGLFAHACLLDTTRQETAARAATHREAEMMEIILVAMSDTDTLKAAGIRYPTTKCGWQWLYRRRHERGVADAFIRSGRRILVHVPRYIELACGSAADARPIAGRVA